MRTRRSLVASAALVLGLTLAGCASSSDSAGSAGPATVEQPAPPGDTGYGSSAGDGTGSAPTVEDARGADAPGSVALDRSIVVVASTTVRVDDVASATDRLSTLVAGAGGRIEAQQVARGGGAPLDTPCIGDVEGVGGVGCVPPVTGYAASTTTVRLDNTEVDAFLRATAALGTVESGSRSSTDVSAEVADVDARVSSAEASLARVRALLARAETIADIVALEGELARRQADLEALQARQRVLADQTAQATVTVALVERDAVLTEEPSTGFLAGLRAGWDAFAAATVGGLTVLGAVLPFAVLAALIAFLVWLVVRRSRRHTPAPTT
jgi:hypothetical protein